MFRQLHDKIDLHFVETRAFGLGVVLQRYQRVDKRQQ
jgi:hypothetical protein